MQWYFDGLGIVVKFLLFPPLLGAEEGQVACGVVSGLAGIQIKGTLLSGKGPRPWYLRIFLMWVSFSYRVSCSLFHLVSPAGYYCHFL
jgi:hypothetical protein